MTTRSEKHYWEISPIWNFLIPHVTPEKRVIMLTLNTNFLTSFTFLFLPDWCASGVTIGTRMEVMQLESSMDIEDYRKLQGLFKVDSPGKTLNGFMHVTSVGPFSQLSQFLHGCPSWCTHQSINVTAPHSQRSFSQWGPFPVTESHRFQLHHHWWGWA